jgi:hypothetical protein
VLRSREQEMQADSWGAVAALKAYRMPYIGGSSPMTYGGVEAFFLATDIIDRALSISQTGIEDTELSLTHSSAEQRRLQLRHGLLTHTTFLAGNPQFRIVGPGQEAVQNPVLRVADKFVGYRDSLWHAITPAFLKRYQAHLKPATIWGALT